MEIPRPLPTGEAPGEILRRQARDLLDEIPAAELPSALAFLEFLRDRGASSLLHPVSAVAVTSKATTTDDDDPALELVARSARSAADRDARSDSALGGV